MQQPRWPGFNRKAEIAWVREHGKTMLADKVKAEKRLLAERIARTRRIFRRKLFIGDVHTHTVFSDGVSTVAENKQIADLLGLDFLFITDHRTLRQKRFFDKKAGLWYGQEPPTVEMEIGLLMPRRLFVPKCDSVAGDFRRAKELAPFIWIPHPTGYGSGRGYSDSVVRNLWKLGNRFAIEILNANGSITRAYNRLSRRAVRTWDQLLCAHRQVTAVGASDAHICYGIGTAWTGAYAAACTPEAVTSALARGHSFASEAPLVWLSLGRAKMGDVLHKKPRAKLQVHLTAADSLGLRFVRLISNGRVVRRIKARDAQCVSCVVEKTMPRRPTYLRLECAALDDRRAFSSPIFLFPA